MESVESYNWAWRIDSKNLIERIIDWPPWYTINFVKLDPLGRNNESEPKGKEKKKREIPIEQTLKMNEQEDEIW